MKSLIVVTSSFELVWSLAADHLHGLWRGQGPVDFIRLDHHRERNAVLSRLVDDPAAYRRAFLMGLQITEADLDAFAGLRELAAVDSRSTVLDPGVLKKRGIRLYVHSGEGYWGQSVAEFALGLTLAALRRIPQTHRQILTEQSPWNYRPADGIGRPGARAIQFGDDDRFVNGTLCGKRVRIAGAGNIGARYARWAAMLGADVAVWDPFAPESVFPLCGARRFNHLDELAAEADIFSPMLPLTPSTGKIITGAFIDALPMGCLIVMVTRAGVCDMQAVRRRVLADEIALAADVFDIEPLPLNDPLLGRANVVHTPHNAGRTRHANQQFVELLAAQFRQPGE